MGAVRSFVKTERIGTLFLTPSATLQGFALKVRRVLSLGPNACDATRKTCLPSRPLRESPLDALAAAEALQRVLDLALLVLLTELVPLVDERLPLGKAEFDLGVAA